MDVREEMAKAKQFAADNLRELAAEIVEWEDTAVLRSGKLRLLASRLEFTGHALWTAESIVRRAALDLASKESNHASH